MSDHFVIIANVVSIQYYVVKAHIIILVNHVSAATLSAHLMSLLVFTCGIPCQCSHLFNFPFNNEKTMVCIRAMNFLVNVFCMCLND